MAGKCQVLSVVIVLIPDKSCIKSIVDILY